jgi:hypothetical protein
MNVSSPVIGLLPTPDIHVITADSMTRSIFTTVIVIAILRALLCRYGYESLSAAFGADCLLHLAGDTLRLLVFDE